MITIRPRPELTDRTATMDRAVLIHTGSKDAFNPEVTWRELIAGRLTTHTVPGKHLEILKEPLIGAVAGHLKNCLEEVRGHDS